RPLVPAVLAAAVLAAAALRPAEAWLLAAGLAPLGLLLGKWIGSPASLAEPIVLAFLAGWLLHEAVRAARTVPPPAPDAVPLAAALLLALTVLASLAVLLSVHQLSVDFPLPYCRRLVRFLWHDYFGRPSRLAILTGPAAEMLEGVGLFLATLALARRQPAFALRGARVLAAGAGLAVAASIAMLARDAIDWGWYAAFPSGLAASRFSAICRDVNAAGSYYVLAFGAAVGLAASDRRLRPAWAAVAGLTMLGLWLAGSRAALAAPAIVAVLAVPVVVRRRARAARAVVTVAVALLAFAAAYAYSTANLRTRAATALEWRVENGLTAARMFAAHPVFGAGVGRFYALSRRYTSPTWPYRQNAHNNFLQILAELGLVGLGLLLGLVGLVLRRWWRAVRQPPARPLLAGLGGGTLAFLLTWLAGHPLLIFEVAVAFWAALGLVAGLSPAAGAVEEQAPAHRRRWTAAAAWVLAVAIAASVVPRARSEVAGADLSRTWTAFSSPHVGRDGTPFRWMAGRAQVYAPSSAREVAVPFRSPNGAATIKVLVDGKVQARAVAAGRRWSEALVRLDGSDRRRFVPLELRASVVLAPGKRDTRVQVATPRVIR
ncbi:MAG: putative rane protein of ExoQ family protein, partial [Acidobacteria bacterium]|nr:putative rane protein of ExoQ family protein [Acidobacteriota bacterium]